MQKPNGECKAASQLSCSNISQTPESNILSLKKLDSIDNKTKILETWVQSAEKSITSFENKIQELYSGMSAQKFVKGCAFTSFRNLIKIFTMKQSHLIELFRFHSLVCSIVFTA